MWTYRTIKKQIQKNRQAPEAEKSSEPPTQPKEICPHRPASAADQPKCEVCVAEKRAARKYRYKLLFLLLPGFFTSSMDLTIVATALPFIASHFGTRTHGTLLGSY